MKTSALRRSTEGFKPSLSERLEQSKEAKKRNLQLVKDPPKQALKKAERPKVLGTTFAQLNPSVTIQTSASDSLTGRIDIVTRRIDGSEQMNMRMQQELQTQMREVRQRFEYQPMTCEVMDEFHNTVTGLMNGHSQRMYRTNGATVSIWSTWATTPVRTYTNEWTTWVDVGTSAGMSYPPRIAVPISRVQIVETEEERKLRAERAEAQRLENERYYQQRRQEEDARIAAQIAANKKAMELLFSCLNSEQAENLKKRGFFYVRAKKSGNVYRIDEGTHGNVKRVDGQGRVIERLCIQPNGVPVGDSMLAQKLMIESFEDQFRAHANITLNDGTVKHGLTSLLDGEKLAQVIPIRKQNEILRVG